MKYSIKQAVVDTRGNRGQIVNVSTSNGRTFYQVLFDKDWSTGRADFIPEDQLFADRNQKAS
jgi:hypothetical protein